MPKHNHPTNHTLPTADPTGRRPPTQPKMPNTNANNPPARKVRLATRDPRRKGG